MSETIISKRALSGTQKRLVKTFGDVVVTVTNGNYTAQFAKDVYVPKWRGVDSPYGPLRSIVRESKGSALNNLFHLVGVVSERGQEFLVNDQRQSEPADHDEVIPSGCRSVRVEYKHA